MLPSALPLRRAYTVDKKILQSGNERVWVILHRPRQYRVLVIRQEGVEAGAASEQPRAVNLGALKRGAGRAVTLTAYKSDVLHALAETGGLPGLAAENTIYVLRSKRRSVAAPPQPTDWRPARRQVMAQVGASDLHRLAFRRCRMEVIPAACPLESLPHCRSFLARVLRHCRSHLRKSHRYLNPMTRRRARRHAAHRGLRTPKCN